MRTKWVGRIGLCGLVFLVGLFSALLGRAPDCAAQQERPNIIWIIGDDHTWPFYGFMGHPIVQTPNLDRLADSGALFPVGHSAASVCKPSFRSLLTGVYPKDFKRHSRGGNGLPYVAQTLAAAGYATFGYGKLWKKFSEVGFVDSEKSFILPRETIEPILDYIDSHMDSQPWFIWYGTRLPHWPFDAPPQFWALYAGLGLDLAEQGYYANISRLDELIGQLLDGLEARGVRHNTLIMYISDNGFFFDSKLTSREDGFRSPIILSYPDAIVAGQRFDGAKLKMAHALDFVPTVLDYAGLPIPPELEGMSLRPLVEGQSVPSWRTYLFDQRGKKRFLRTESGLRYWKLGKRKAHLFDLNTDPREEIDLIADPTYQAIIPVLDAALDDWWYPWSR